MYGRFESNGYYFDNENDFNAFMVANDPENCTGWGGPSPENYGGYKEPDASDRKTYADEPEYYDKHYHTSAKPKDRTFYHGPFEEFTIVHETEKAYLLNESGNHFWCPKSLIIEPTIILSCIRCRLWKNIKRTYINLQEPF